MAPNPECPKRSRGVTNTKVDIAMHKQTSILRQVVAVPKLDVTKVQMRPNVQPHQNSRMDAAINPRMSAAVQPPSARQNSARQTGRATAATYSTGGPGSISARIGTPRRSALAPKDGMDGEWRVMEVIGGGSSATVYRAIQKHTGLRAAVKVVRSEEGGRDRKITAAEEEAQLLAKICHPCVNRLIQTVSPNEGTVCMFLEERGSDLLHVINKIPSKRMEAGPCFQIFHRLVSALVHIHRMGVAHRDIKLENILLSNESGSDAQLSDFGLAGRVEATPDGLMRMHCGSPHYSAPEIFTDDAYDGPKVDVWSLGVVLFGLFAGRLPFMAPDPRELMEDITQGRFQFPEYFEGDLKEILTAMLTVEPNRRCTAQELTRFPFWIRGCRMWCLLPDGVRPNHAAQHQAGRSHVAPSPLFRTLTSPRSCPSTPNQTSPDSSVEEMPRAKSDLPTRPASPSPKPRKQLDTRYPPTARTPPNSKSQPSAPHRAPRAQRRASPTPSLGSGKRPDPPSYHSSLARAAPRTLRRSLTASVATGERELFPRGPTSRQCRGGVSAAASAGGKGAGGQGSKGGSSPRSKSLTRLATTGLARSQTVSPPCQGL